MRTTKACLFGGALFTAGLTAHADAQCTIAPRDTFTVNPFPSPYETEVDAFTASNGKLYTNSLDGGYSGSNYFISYHLQVWDISDPQNATRIGLSQPDAFELSAIPDAMAAVGNTLAGVRSGNAVLIDVTDPGNLSEIRTFDLPGFVRRLFEGSGLLYVQSRVPDSLTILDVANPLTPQVIATLPGGAGFEIGAPVGTEIPFRDNTRVGIIDVSDPANPTTVSMPGSGTDPVLVGNTVVADAGGVLQVFDFTDPGNPVRRSDFSDPTGSSTNDVVSSGLFIYIADVGTIHAIDFTDPAQPAVVSTTGGDDMKGLFVAGGLVIASQNDAEIDGGFGLFDVSSCAVQPTVLVSPISRLVEASATPEAFSIVSSDATDYQWFRDGQLLAEGGDFTGVTTPDLTVLPNEATEGIYTCTITNPDGSDTSAPAFLGVRAAPNPCVSDLNGDGILDLADINTFIQSFVAGCN